MQFAFILRAVDDCLMLLCVQFTISGVIATINCACGFFFFYFVAAVRYTVVVDRANNSLLITFKL